MDFAEIEERQLQHEVIGALCQIQDLETSRAEEAAAVIRASFAEHVVVPPSAALEETTATLRASEGFVAVVDRRVVGCVLTRDGGDHLYLGRLAVLPSHRNQGLGEALVEAVEMRAHALVRPEVRLGVRISLPGNRRFFEKRGYSVSGEGTHRDFQRPTFVWMSKAISTPQKRDDTR